MYAVQKDVCHLTGSDKTIVDQILRWANNLFNVWIDKNLPRYFNNRSVVKYPQLYKTTKTHENYGLLYSQVAQQSLKSVAESFRCFRTLEKLAKHG
ncbi:hypothetical protein IQ270_22110 [Microcoleus sp. LEGE 07076]|uniref:hypothetical protein n=1 Tax=Microcoleus sp. LEGE 07076 TaxID=915322 RepID=UPI0018801F45|nr:hypothetical protein [Microcoleus sp. LEGE 07076]MBE9187273.1 hypothetical protein [Microcoleus sp. LEGE 07076]